MRSTAWSRAALWLSLLVGGFLPFVLGLVLSLLARREFRRTDQIPMKSGLFLSWAASMFFGLVIVVLSVAFVSGFVSGMNRR